MRIAGTLCVASACYLLQYPTTVDVEETENWMSSDMHTSVGHITQRIGQPRQ